jgi:uncharacterized damage-inducible protein DinB
MNLTQLFPYRNDIRKTLIPYLQTLHNKDWFRSHPDHPNSIAWIVRHMASSEDEWINATGFGRKLTLIHLTESPKELLESYINIREQTDIILEMLTWSDGDRPIKVPSFSDGWKPPSTPKLRWVFHHVYEHEAYHVGQIGVIARLNGFVGPHF